VFQTIGTEDDSLRGVAIDDMREAARRLIAAECSGFTRDTNLASPKDVPERWSAHIDWLKNLNERHTIITFNYDRALEMIGRYNQSQGGKSISVRLPGSTPSTDLPTVLKLHGSVDWGYLEDGADASGQQRYTFKVVPHEKFALTAESRQLVLGTPGPSKSALTVILSDLWTAAEAAIAAADAIVFVGYRFPPTDANARRRLLRAIENCAKKQERARLALHVVLGPGCPDARRLEELLRFAARRGELQEDAETWDAVGANRFRIRVHQLFSQDFFDVYDEKFLMF
jgi:hypothetical protein